MALRKAIAPEALDLLEGALGKILGITPFDHAADELVVEMRYPARQFEGRHRPPQLIGFGRGEARADDRDLPRLLLKERAAERLLEHRATLGLRHFRPFLAGREGVLKGKGVYV